MRVPVRVSLERVRELVLLERVRLLPERVPVELLVEPELRQTACLNSLRPYWSKFKGRETKLQRFFWRLFI